MTYEENFCQNVKDEKYVRTLMKVLEIINELDQPYLLIKFIDLPPIKSVDIDLLVEMENARKALHHALVMNGFLPLPMESQLLTKSIYRVLYNRKQNYVDPRSQVVIDVYHSPVQYGIQWAPPGLLTLKRVLGEICGKKVYRPHPTHDIYIIIVHSFFHGRIKRSELTYIAKVALENKSKINYDEVISLSEQYGFKSVVYIYFYLLNNLFIKTGIMNYRIKEILKEGTRSLSLRIFAKQLKTHIEYSSIEFSFTLKAILILESLIYALKKGKPFFTWLNAIIRLIPTQLASW